MDRQCFLDKMLKDFKDYLDAQGITEALEISGLARKLSDGISEISGGDEAFCLSSENAVLEIIDEKTGRLYRRYLELSYRETSHGIRLLGEDIKGAPANIVFLSAGAIEKINELRGNGPDESPCDEH